MKVPVRLVAFAAFAAVALTACDNVAQYVVVNETNEELTTWAMFKECEVGMANRHHYLPEDKVRPHSTHEYYHVHGAPRVAKCVQVIDGERRLLLSEPYQRETVYVIRDPLQLSDDPIPERGDIPKAYFFSQWREDFRERPVAATFWAAGILTILGGLVFALGITARFFWHHYTGRG